MTLLQRLRLRHARTLSLGIWCVLLLCGCGSSTSMAAAPLTGTLHIDGSTALEPLVAQAATLFMNLHPQTTVAVANPQDPTQISHIGSKNGLKDINAGTVDIGDSDIYADPAVYTNPQLTDHIVCVIPFTMIVNPDVSNVTSLTSAQLIAIYATNTITNWNQVGGPDLTIKRIIRPPSSGTRATFREFVLGGRDETVAGYGNTELKQDSSKNVLAAVAATPGAIGYTGLSVLQNVTSVKELGIDGVSVSAAAIAAGTYPFWGFEHMYTLGDTSPLVNAFLAFMYGDQVQTLAPTLGYYAINAIVQVAPAATATTQAH